LNNRVKEMTTIRLHNFKNETGSKHRRIRKGRGKASGKGKTSGRGHKGQKARKGSSIRVGFEGGQMPLVRRLPKRGFKNPTRTVYIPVNVGDLSRFNDGAEVDVSVLRKTGLARGRGHGVKILGQGELKKKLTVKASAFSSSAKSKIEAAGGVCEVVTG